MKEPTIIEISHVALMVKDLQIAKSFYAEVLGLQEIIRPSFFIKGLWFKLGKSQLHLMLCENTTPPPIHPLCETVQPHFAMTLINNEFLSLVHKLKTSAVNIIGDIETNSFGIQQFFFYDPDSNMLEINSMKG